jgi:murein DD-endopeptidase MepM/ murein hydrolase activator NlpD
MDCGLTDSLIEPVDTARFALMQAYTAPSPRHQGRYHTGEDWSIAGGEALGEVVGAAGRGKVRYSYPQGWGRDAGVVILEHRMTDGVTLYSQYGHLTESQTVTFPAVGTCIEAGTALGVIADVRPAPHLHFEIRLAQPDTPGQGYTWMLPETNPIGYRSPSILLDAYAPP